MATTTNVPAPPKKMAPTRPNKAAVTPDSKAPSSLDAPINTFSTASTRPRMSSGVASGTRLARMNIDTASTAAAATRAMKATAKLRVKPSTMVRTPNMATMVRSRRPTCRRSGRIDRVRAVPAAPIPTAARNQPRPTAPTPRRSSAMAGSRAITPPKSTANRSRLIAPNTIGVRRMKRSPSKASRATWRAPAGRCWRTGGRGTRVNMAIAAAKPPAATR